MSWSAGTKRWRGTFPMAAITASLNLGRPVSAPVSRAIAAISATIRARAAARGSWASAGWEWVTASSKSAESKTPSMARPSSGDHQGGQPLRIGKQIRARTAVGDAAAVEHERALRDSECHFRVLLDQHDRKRVLVDQALQGLEQDLDDDGREPFERLVHEQQGRIAHQRAPDREHLLFAARDLVAPVPAPLGELRKEIVDACQRPAAGARGDGEVLLDREGREDVARLRHEAHAQPAAFVDGQPRDRLALVFDASRVKSRVAHDGREERGLADAVPTQYRKGAALRQLERDVFEDHGFAVTGAHVAQAELSHDAVRRDAWRHHTASMPQGHIDRGPLRRCTDNSELPPHAALGYHVRVVFQTCATA